MLSKKFLQEVNERPRGRGPAPLVALGSLAAAAVVGFLVSWLAAAAILMLGGISALLIYRKDAARRIKGVDYDLGGDREMAARFAFIGKAAEILSTSENVWLREGSSRSSGKKSSNPGGAEERKSVRVGRLEKPGISTNVDVWGLAAEDTVIYFFPEAVLVLEDDRYRAISYKTFNVLFASEKVAERGTVPSDTEVLGETYLYTLSDGEPDRRLGSNPRLPEVLYGDLDLLADGWRGLKLRVSKETAAAQFVLAFAREEDPERHERWQGTRPALDRGRADGTHEILGLPTGATKVEVTAAYRRLARTYHPDKTSGFLPEFRELAEQRMKDVNAAYARLRRGAS